MSEAFHCFAMSIATSTHVGVRSNWSVIVGALPSVPINLRMLALTVAGHIHTESQTLDYATPDEVYAGALAALCRRQPGRST